MQPSLSDEKIRAVQELLKQKVSLEPALDDNRNWYTEDELEACNTPELPNGKTHTERPGAD